MCDLSEHFEFEVCSRLIGVIAADFLVGLNEFEHLVRLSFVQGKPRTERTTRCLDLTTRIWVLVPGDRDTTGKRQ